MLIANILSRSCPARVEKDVEEENVLLQPVSRTREEHTQGAYYQTAYHTRLGASWRVLRYVVQ